MGILEEAEFDKYSFVVRGRHPVFILQNAQNNGCMPNQRLEADWAGRMVLSGSTDGVWMSAKDGSLAIGGSHPLSGGDFSTMENECMPISHPAPPCWTSDARAGANTVLLGMHHSLPPQQISISNGEGVGLVVMWQLGVRPAGEYTCWGVGVCWDWAAWCLLARPQQVILCCESLGRGAGGFVPFEAIHVATSQQRGSASQRLVILCSSTSSSSSWSSYKAPPRCWTSYKESLSQSSLLYKPQQPSATIHTTQETSDQSIRNLFTPLPKGSAAGDAAIRRTASTFTHPW